MPDYFDDEENELTERAEYDDEQAKKQDEDVPFHLPMAEEEVDDPDQPQPLFSHKPPPEPKPEELWDNERDSHNMPTMPVPREPGSQDPKKTLAGSGGLDPNPDFQRPPKPQRPGGQATMVGTHPAVPPPPQYSRPVQAPPPPPPPAPTRSRPAIPALT